MLIIPSTTGVHLLVLALTLFYIPTTNFVYHCIPPPPPPPPVHPPTSTANMKLSAISLLLLALGATEASNKNDAIRRAINPSDYDGDVIEEDRRLRTASRGGKSAKSGKSMCSEDFPKNDNSQIFSAKEETEEFAAILQEGDDPVELFTFGPYTVYVECEAGNDDGVPRLYANIGNPNTCDTDLFIFGDTADDSGLMIQLASGDSERSDLWELDGGDIGNDPGNGALFSSSGYYIGWDGESVIGKNGKSGTPSAISAGFGFSSAGNNADCIMVGKFKLMQFSE
eukprot:scaffold563431_cov106-Attheya_sp.AAC.1